MNAEYWEGYQRAMREKRELIESIGKEIEAAGFPVIWPESEDGGYINVRHPDGRESYLQVSQYYPMPSDHKAGDIVDIRTYFPEDRKKARPRTFVRIQDIADDRDKAVKAAVKLFFGKCSEETGKVRTYSQDVSSPVCCPACSSVRMDYGTWTPPEPGGAMRYPFLCEGCGVKGAELGELVFRGHDTLEVPEALAGKESEPASVMQRGVCPICGGAIKHTGELKSQDEWFYCPWICSCGTKGEENYEVEFRGYEVEEGCV